MLYTFQADHQRITHLAKRLIDGITSQIDSVVRNGDPNGYPGCVNLSFAYVEGESLLMALKASIQIRGLATSRLTDVCIVLLDRPIRILLFPLDPLAHRPHSNRHTYCERWEPPRIWHTAHCASGLAVSLLKRKSTLLFTGLLVQ